MDSRESRPPLMKALADAVLSWAPVMVALALLAQVGLLGLRPALTERERLTREEARVEVRHSAALQHFTDLDQQVEAWADPIYRERLKRQR
ncbi:MAG: hypothetical protein ACI8QZ_000402 [Chlamydiales bacterium]|jgi:hypothetical protein